MLKILSPLIAPIFLVIVFTGCNYTIQPEENKNQQFHIDNPYEDVNWQNLYFLHSMSHQHTGTYGVKDISRMQALVDMGFEHLLLSNYYPSKPTYPLPDTIKGQPGVIGGPVAEHHSVTDLDFMYHFSGLGSQYVTGYGKNLTDDIDGNEFSYSTSELNIYDKDSEIPGSGIYRLDLRSRSISDDKSFIELSVKGGVHVDRGTFEEVNDGQLSNEMISADQNVSSYFKVMEDTVEINLTYDSDNLDITQLRIMQGSNRPWRQLFSQLLDGEKSDNNDPSKQGLLYKDAGGIVIHHPGSSSVDTYLDMLDFDDRVLGIEVWNHRRLFGLEDKEPHMRYYNHWDSILSTGRQSFGFFVKDHRLNGLGRNILMVPDTAGRSAEQRKKDALSAYRNGEFFGLLGAPEINEENNIISPYDFSEFRFNQITIDSTMRDDLISLHVEVEGNDQLKQPNLQIRFITEAGISKVVDNSRQAEFNIEIDESGTPNYKYVRIEAISYPDTHNQGENLTKQMVRKMNVYDLIRLHDFVGDAGGNDIDDEGQEPISIVDIIFSQPIGFVH